MEIRNRGSTTVTNMGGNSFSTINTFHDGAMIPLDAGSSGHNVPDG